MAVQTTTRALVTGGDPEARYLVPRATDFIDPDTRDVLEYLPADDLERVAALLFAKHDQTFAAASDLRIVFRWKREGGETTGKQTIGQCVKANPLLRHLANVDLVIWLAADHLIGHSAYHVEAALFHELLHVGMNDKSKPFIFPHDYAGFNRELQEYGAWYADLRLMADTARQLSLFDSEA